MLGADCNKFLIRSSNGSRGALSKLKKNSKIFWGIQLARLVIPQSSAALTEGINANKTIAEINVLPHVFLIPL